MEADWEIEIGPGAPVIDACWPDFVDLRESPDRVSEIAEAAQVPALANTLIQLNRDPSTWWTSKCDLWIPEEFDPDEMNASSEDAPSAIACYIDLLPRETQIFPSIESAEAHARSIVARLKPCTAACCRIDLIVRSAALPQTTGFGITAYITGCGATSDAAETTLAAALKALAHASR
jgi:hypothetical protein